MTHVRKLAWILPLLLAACADTAGPRPVGGDASLAPSSVPAPAPTPHGKIGVAPQDIAPGAADSLFDTNHAGTASEWFTLGGDVTFASHSATVVGLRGAVLPSLTSGVLEYTGSAWTFASIPGAIAWADDLAGSTNSAQYVVNLSGGASPGTVTITSPTLSAPNALTLKTTSGNLSLDSAGALYLGPAVATSVQAGNDTTTVESRQTVTSSGAITGYVGSTYAYSIGLATASDFLDLGTGGTGLELEAHTVDSSGQLELGTNGATNVQVGGSTNNADIALETKALGVIEAVVGSTQMFGFSGQTSDYVGFDASFGSTGYLRVPTGAQTILAANGTTLLDSTSGGATELRSQTAGSGGGLNLYDTSTEMLSAYNTSSTTTLVVPAGQTGGFALSTTQPTGTGTKPGPGLDFVAGQGQLQTGGAANTNGGSFLFTPGTPGTGGSGAAGVYGGLSVLTSTSSMVTIGDYAIGGAAANSYGAIWLDTNAPSQTNCGFLGNQSATWLNAPSGGTLELATNVVPVVTINSGSVQFLTPNLEIAAAEASPDISQLGQSTDVAANNLTLTSQAPWASASTNKAPGNIVLNTPAPVSGGATGFTVFQSGGTAEFWIGSEVAAPTYGGIYAGSATPTNTNYLLLGNGTNAVLNAASVSGDVWLGTGGDLLWQLTGSAMSPYSAGGLEAGTATLPWGKTFLGSDTSSHYYSYEGLSGTADTQVGHMRHIQCLYEQTSTGTQTACSGSAGSVFCPASGVSAGVVVTWTAVGATNRPTNAASGQVGDTCSNVSGTASCGTTNPGISSSVGSGLCTTASPQAPTITIVAGSGGCFVVDVGCAVSLDEGDIDYDFDVFTSND